MEHKKDIFYRTNKGLNKGQERLNGSYKGSAQEAGIAGGNLPANVQEYDFAVFLNKKTEKLTTALYMVTSFLSDSEPLKWKLRGRGVDLLSNIATVRNGSVSEVENIFADHCPCVEEMISLLEVAAASKLISEMNFAILKKEYVSLKSFIDSDEHAERRTGRFVFPQSFFVEDGVLGERTCEQKFSEAENVSDSEAQTKGHYEHIRQAGSPSVSDTAHAVSQRQKGSSVGGGTRSMKDRKRTIKTHKDGRTDRRVTILKLFKKNKELTIKDISCEVSGCSEKTIQRELLALVSDGVLNKKGERRWSRYSLK